VAHLSRPSRGSVVTMSMQLAADGDRFTAYGTSHQVALGVLLAGIVVIVWFGRRHRGTPLAERLGRVFAVAVLAVTLPLQVLYFTPGYWDLQKTLPLQLCDLASMVAVYALWTRRRWAAAVTYFWGLTLTSQAMLTPDLAADFPDPVFLLFWAMHLLVVWAAVYVVWGLGLAPTWRTYGVAVAVTAVWAVTVFTFNVVAGTNYGYLNGKPAATSALDLLGPWPWYVLAEIAIVAVFWALITWPWAGRRRAGADLDALDPTEHTSQHGELGRTDARL
jgi:hypothetical integral membrane protein (TIGR02206 family)